MYLALRPPWGGVAMAPAIDAGVGEAPTDGGPPAKRRKKSRRRPGTIGTPGAPGGADEYEETEPALANLTDADRRLEWRGDDVTLPATRVDMAGGEEARPLDDGEINATIGAQGGGVRQCVIEGATGTDLRATITVKLVVDGRGRVIRSRIQAPRYLFEHGLHGCVQRAVGRMKFPATGAPTLVTLPVHLG